MKAHRLYPEYGNFCKTKDTASSINKWHRKFKNKINKYEMNIKNFLKEMLWILKETQKQ